MHSLLRAVGAAFIASVVVAAPAAAAPSQREPGKAPFDIRTGQRVEPAVPSDAASAKGRERLSDRLGRQGLLEFDAQTNTPRVVAKLDGFLTGPSSDDAAKVALDYVRSHESVFHLGASDIDGLKLVRRYTDEGGTTHLVWAQVHDGIKFFDNDLHANVASDGRLINITGSPVSDAATRTTDPAVSARLALNAALTDAGRAGVSPAPHPKGTSDQLTTFAGGHDARLVLFTERPGDIHLAWEVTAVKGASEIYDYVIDARSGELLYRKNMVDFAAATLNVWDYAPGIDAFGPPAVAGQQTLHTALIGGDSIQVDSGAALNGPYAHTYLDTDDNDQPDGEVAASSGTTWSFPLANFGQTNGFTNTWDSSTAFSWQSNQNQNAAQVYYYVNNFHDWLAKNGDIGFTPASGNFERAGGDAVNAEALDGANTASGFPDDNHNFNANMSTQRDGLPPRMQMFLFASDGFNTPEANGGDDASVIYHEYTHGLSNRLVTGGTGAPALRSFQADSMGEGWSDWYAMDYLFDQGLDTGDTPTPGEVNIGFYIEGGQTSSDLRSQSLDCPVDPTATQCPGGNTGHQGGYTLADVGHVINGPEVHADGEIWAETLWDIRTAIGGPAARRDITDGMRLSPPDPSMLDMRNAIIQADVVRNGGANVNALWQAFAKRGMGIGAAVDSSADTTPTADFSVPSNTAGVTVSGRVTDSVTGAGVASAYIEFEAGGAPGDYATAANSNGDYSISGMQPSTFARVKVAAPGFAHAVKTGVQASGGGVNFAIDKNFAAAVLGAKVTGFTPPDFSGDGCGPGNIIDGTLTQGWGSASPGNAQGPGPKAVTVQLAAPTDVSAIAVDPTANCGDADSASTGQFKVEVSADGASFSQVAQSTFDTSSLGKLNTVSGASANVRFIRFTMISPQRQLTTNGDGPQGQDSGVAFMDSTEIEVYGRNAAPVTPGPGPSPFVDITGPTVRAAIARASLKIKTALKKGLKVAVTCNEPCKGSLAGTIDAKTAKKLKLLKKKSKAKTFKVASGSLKLGSGKRTLTMKFSRKAASKLKRLKKFTVTVSGTFSDAAGNKTKVKGSAKLKR